MEIIGNARDFLDEAKKRIIDRGMKNNIPNITLEEIETVKQNRKIPVLQVKIPYENKGNTDFSNFGVCVHLNNLLDKDFTYEGKDIDKFVENVFSAINDFKKVNKDMGNIKNYDEVKGFIIPALVSVSGNEEYLAPLATSPFKDLAIMYRIDHEGMSIPVQKMFLNSWDIDLDTLHKTAIENMQKSEEHILSMASFMEKQMDGPLPKFMYYELPPEDFMLVCARAMNGAYGASIMLEDGLYEKITDKFKSNFYILPSSIHEVICVKDTPALNLNIDFLKDMVRDINETEVKPEEKLSDSVYYYDIDTKTLSVYENDYEQEEERE